MNKNQFDLQLERLRDSFGDKSYGLERSELFFKTFGSCDYKVFSAAVDELIGEEKFAPMKSKIMEAITLVRKTMPDIPEPNGCFSCSNTGRILIKQNKGAHVAYSCICELGRTYETYISISDRYKNQRRNYVKS